MAQPKYRKEKSLCVIISLREKVCNISAETRGLVHWEATVANAESISLLLRATDRWFRVRLFSLNCFQAGGSSAASSPSLHNWGLKFLLHVAWKFPRAKLLYVSATFIMLLYNPGKFSVTVCMFMANHNNITMKISRIFDIFGVVSLEFGDWKLLIGFVIELARLCFLLCNCLMVG